MITAANLVSLKRLQVVQCIARSGDILEGLSITRTKIGKYQTQRIAEEHGLAESGSMPERELAL